MREVASRERAKNAVRRVLTWAGYAFNRTLRPPQRNALTVLNERAFADSADLIEANLATASLFSSAEEIQAHVSTLLEWHPRELHLEFGFWEGQSARVLRGPTASPPPSDAASLYSFDAFEGLRDSWSQIGMSVGSFSRQGAIPEAPPGVELVVGWVEDTLAAFLEEQPGSVAFAHMDLDVYPPTVFALRLLRPRMREGCLLLFDELHGYPGWRHHEYRALCDVFESDEFEFVAFGPQQGLVRVLS